MQRLAGDAGSNLAFKRLTQYITSTQTHKQAREKQMRSEVELVFSAVIWF